jgi:hypothetical protein
MALYLWTDICIETVKKGWETLLATGNQTQLILNCCLL